MQMLTHPLRSIRERSAQRDPEAQRAFFHFLKTYDLSSWRVYGYPETPIIQRYKAAANPIPLWFAEMTDGDAASYSSNETAKSFKDGCFCSTATLYADFTSWAKLYAPTSKLTMVMFEKAIKIFAERNGAKIRYANVRPVVGSGTQRGYIDPSASAAAAAQRAAAATVRGQFDD